MGLYGGQTALFGPHGTGTQMLVSTQWRSDDQLCPRDVALIALTEVSSFLERRIPRPFLLLSERTAKKRVKDGHLL